MRFIPLAVLVAASPAAAQPISQPTDCAVTVARAPDDVRLAIEAWIARETRCSSRLEIRVVVTEGGYYLIARDEHGRIRDRIVPDAQSAGLLVASWSADDALPPPRTPFDERAPLGSRSREPDPMPDQLAPPGVAPEVAATATSTARPPGSKWLSLAGMVGMQDGGGKGLRAELDVKSWRQWSLGFAASFSDSYLNMNRDFMKVFDTKTMATLSHTLPLGRWHLRTAAGAGLVFTRATATVFTGMSYEDYSAKGTFPAAEVSLSLARELGKSWAISAGPIVSVFGQSYTVMVNDPVWGPEPHSLDRRVVDIMMLFALRHRL